MAPLLKPLGGRRTEQEGIPKAPSRSAWPVRVSISRREIFWRPGRLEKTGTRCGISKQSLIQSRDASQYKFVESTISNPSSRDLVRAARRLSQEVSRLTFSSPVSHVYNPLAYAWAPHETYLRRFGTGEKEVIFLGMNPGPFGMVQTGVPFGEISAVRDWLKIEGTVGKPGREHPKRLITGFGCTRSEISGQRLWGLFARRFSCSEAFFAAHMVMNYCPLAFLGETGSNLTPDKLPARERGALLEACDKHLRSVIRTLRPGWLIGVGDFAAKRAAEVFTNGEVKIGRILHPSPASPAANRGWSEAAERALTDCGVPLA